MAVFAPVVIVCGHYGVGKTNFSLNLAHDAAARGCDVTLIDLDVVNPYFRSSDYTVDLESWGVRVISPVFASRGTSLDVPSLTGAIAPAIEQAQLSAQAGETCDAASAGDMGAEAFGESVFAPEDDGDADDASRNASAAWLGFAGVALPERMVVIDAGGDDAGTTALGRFAPAIASAPYEMLYVVNERRNLTQTPEEAVSVLREIEAMSGLAATAVVNNTHLQGETDRAVIERGVPFAQAVASAVSLPLACTTVPFDAARALFDRTDAPTCQKVNAGSLYPVRIYVRTPWDAQERC